MTIKLAPAVRFPGFTDVWEQRKVFDMSEITFGGGTPQTGIEDYWQGNFPWIQSSDLKNDQLCNVIPTKFITDEAINKSATKAVPANSIAVVTRVGVGKLALMPYPYATSQDFLSLSNLKVDPWFGVYSLYVLIQKEINNIQGTSIKGMTKSDLLSKNIHIPFALDEQTKIGNFFKQLDDTIALHQRKLNLLKQLKQTYLQALFPQSEMNIPTLRFAGFSDPWEQRKVSSLAKETYGGGTPRTGVKKYWNGSAPWIQSSDLSINQLHNVQPTKYITEEAIKQSATHNVPDNSIAIVTRVGVGKLALMRSSYSTSQDFLSLSNLNVDAVFGVYCLYKMLQREVNNIQGTSIKGITKADLLGKCVSVPTKVEEQVKIGAFFKKIDDTIDFHESKLKHILELKKAFLEKMFL